MPMSEIASPPIKGHTTVTCPVFSFLISNGTRHVLYDLAIRKDWQNLPPAVHESFEELSMHCTVDKDIAHILDEDDSLGIKSADIEAIIWSHHHWDHTGNPALFPHRTALIVGPGFKDDQFPWYPEDPESPLPSSDFEGRELREIRFDGLKINGCDALDYFGDGSFYILGTPGHTTSHLSALARTASNPDRFILIVGDASDHCGKIRPSAFVPLPRSIVPSPWPNFVQGGCPGELFQRIHRNQRADEPFYTPWGLNDDQELSKETQDKIIELDGCDEVWTVLAHDDSLLGQFELFPHSVDDWAKNELGKKTRWRFLSDFIGALED